MPIYKYQITAEIEVDAPNIMAAEKAIKPREIIPGAPFSVLAKLGEIRVIGNRQRSIRLPSQRNDERRVWVSVKIGDPKIQRIKKP